MSSSIFWIANEQELESACTSLQNSSWIAVDTEFERVKTYYPEVCLIQIATDKDVFIIDPLAISSLDSLFDLLANRQILKIFHAARQDLEIFHYLMEQIPAPLFDSQIAARYLGIADQISYAGLVEELLDIQLEKAFTRFNWKTRPLKEEHINYAAEDVIYLARLYPLLLDKLQQLDQAQQQSISDDFTGLESPSIYETDPDKMWKKIFEAKRYRGRKLQVIKKIAAWRELKAREENVPRKWFLSNQVIINLANFMPEEISDLDKIHDLDKKKVQRFGKDMLEIIAGTDN